jgi:hypothetical protein
MELTRRQLDAAVAHGVLGAPQAEALWLYLAQQGGDPPRFKPAHILYYLGGLIAIGAMTLFMNLGWERLGGAGLLGIALGYAALAVALTETLLHRLRLPLPAGITGVLAVVMVPMAVYGAQVAGGWWPQDGQLVLRDFHTRVDWRWLLMEFATLAAAALALWRYRLPFLVLPLAVTLWYMSMDLAPLLWGGEPLQIGSERGKWMSVLFGLGTIALALVVDLRVHRAARLQPAAALRDHAFWLHVFGATTLWGGLTSMDSGSELGRLVYALLNLALIGLGAALVRRVFAVYGGLGLALYLGHLSHTLFKDSLLFPLALTAIGLALVGAGIVWQRHEAAIGARLRAWLPPSLRDLAATRLG